MQITYRGYSVAEPEQGMAILRTASRSGLMLLSQTKQANKPDCCLLQEVKFFD